MPDEPSSTELGLEQRVDALCDRFELSWQDGHQPRLTDYLQQAPEPVRPRVLAELWAIELHHRRDAQGDPLSEAQLAERYPELAEQLEDLPTLSGAGPASITWASLDPLTARKTTPAAPIGGSGRPTDSRGLHIRCPHCSNAVELLADSPVDDVECESCGSQFSLVDSDDQGEPAHTLETVGRFELIGRLGVGGFGTVWKARDTELERIVALKIPRKGRLSTREAEQFLREARSAAQLRHPNIVPVFEVGREGDSLFIVSEFVRGVTLSKWLGLNPRDHRESARLCATLADALHAAHSEGVVHRDLKPSNVMLDLAGRPRLMDFGLAKRDAGEITMTMDGQVLGTPAYMSPEQARGHGHWTDRRTDVYSLGVMLFEMLTGELPFRGSAALQIQRRLTADPPSPRSLDRGVPEDLATVCLKCMEQDPNRRYQAAAEVAEELRRWLEGRPINARPLSRPARAMRWAQRRPAVAAALLLGAVLAVVGPAAAVVINSQRLAIQTRLDERDGLITAAQRDKARLQADAAALRRQLDFLTGGPRQQQLAPWRQELVASLLAERQEAYQQQIAQMPPGGEKSRGLVCLATLFGAVERNEEAAECLTAALRDGALPRGMANEATLALADLCLQGDQPEAAELALRPLLEASEGDSIDEKLISLRTRLLLASAEQEPQAKKATLAAALRLKNEVSQQWPEEISGAYRIASELAEAPKPGAMP